jgi:hypothetical protein
MKPIVMTTLVIRDPYTINDKKLASGLVNNSLFVILRMEVSLKGKPQYS